MPDRCKTFFACLIAFVYLGSADFILSAGHSAPLVLKGRIVVNGLNVREKPSSQSGVLTVLPQDTIVDIHNHLSGWYEILLPDQQRGFISDRPEYVRMEHPDPDGFSLSSPETRQQDADRLHQKTRQIQSNLRQHQAEIQSLSQDETGALQNLGRMERRISQTRTELNQLSAESLSIEARIEESSARQRELSEKKNLVERQAAQRLKTLYKLSRLGAMNILISATSLSEFEYRRNMLSRILSEDWKLLAELSEMRKELDELTAGLSALQEENRGRQSLIQKKREFLSSEKERQKAFLAEIRSQKTLEMKAIEALQQASRELNLMLEKLTSEPREPRLPATLSPDPDSSGSLLSRKGRLPPPVAGKAGSSAIADLQSGIGAAAGRPGIHFQTDRGEPVHAIHPGKIVFSEWVKGYGKMIIIDHGDHYFSVYAHLEEFFRIRDDIVQANDIIGTAGETSSVSGAGVYFEIRKKSEPIDLKQWLATPASQ